MANKPFLQNSWYWWETNDKYLWNRPWQFHQWVSVDISNSKYFKSANGYLPPNTFEFTNSSIIKQILIGNQSINRLIFFENWEIRNLSGTVSSIWKTIVNASIIKNKWFIISTDWSIWVWDYQNNANLWISDWISYFNILWSVDLKFACLYIEWDFIYIWTWSKVYVVDTSASSWVLDSTLDLISWQIRWLTKIWNQFNIYVNLWESWRQYIWAWVWAEDFIEEINWIDRTILNVANMNNVDYVVCEDWLYQATWYQPIVIYNRFFISEYTNAIETYQNKIYIPWFNCIYSYESLKAGFPYQMTTEVIIPSDRDASTVSCLAILPKVFSNIKKSFVSDVFIAYKNTYIENATQNYIIQYATRRRLQFNNNMGWYITTNYIPSLYSSLKNNKKIRLWFFLSNTGIWTRDFKYLGIENTFSFKNSIAIIQDIDGDIITAYIGNVTTKPDIWAVYAIEWQNCTVLENKYLFENWWKWNGWISFKIPATWNIELLDLIIWRMTKVSWTWDTNVFHLKVHKWSLIELYDNNNMNGKSSIITWDFRETRFTIHITDWNMSWIENNERLLNKVYDFWFVFNDTQLDFN
jgi:hypothetical protein